MRSVLITGTSTGIGKATAVALATHGWQVFATMRDLKKRGLLDQALKAAGVQNGVEVAQLDVACGASIQAATDVWEQELALDRLMFHQRVASSVNFARSWLHLPGVFATIMIEELSGLRWT
jgi:NAD(P)-dependent dehydrogenase (short-subunit alcohol dehydrogenase family)